MQTYMHTTCTLVNKKIQLKCRALYCAVYLCVSLSACVCVFVCTKIRWKRKVTQTERRMQSLSFSPSVMFACLLASSFTQKYIHTHSHCWFNDFTLNILSRNYYSNYKILINILCIQNNEFYVIFPENGFAFVYIVYE